MFPTDFDESTGYLNPPKGVSPDDIVPLSVWQGEDTGGTPLVISCWKPTREELAEINRTGRVWLILIGGTMQPARLDGFKPFTREED